jgi:hypothetical protein
VNRGTQAAVRITVSYSCPFGVVGGKKERKKKEAVYGGNPCVCDLVKALKLSDKFLKSTAF